MDPVGDAWLRLTTEAPIDPDLRICDPHHHLWEHRGKYLLDEFLQDTGSGHKIVSTVFVECTSMYRKNGPQEMRPIGETDFVERIAAQGASERYGRTVVAAGIVGYADLTLGPAVAPVLDAHLLASPHRFRGIRHSVTWDASPAVRSSAPNPRPGWMLDATFRAGVACLQKYGLTFDAWLFHPQLPELASLARAFPDIPMVLNHIGAPLGVGPYAARRDEVFEAWKRGITEVAACPNVVVKLGGLGMPRCGFAWDDRPTPPTSTELAEATGPYYLFCIEQFGPSRCMFESNFPVDKISYSYNVLWNSFKRITQNFSPTERAAMFHGTASRVYRLVS